MKRFSEKYKRKKFIRYIFGTVLAITTVVFTIYPGWQYIYEYTGIYPKSTDKMSVSFLDVGQGDCIYVSVENHNMLIDCGSDINCEKLHQFFQRNSITKLDAVIGTHPDSDHIGGMNSVLKNYKVNNVYFPEIKGEIIDNAQGYKSCLAEIHRQKIPLHYVNSDLVDSDEFVGCFKDMLKVNFLSPDREYGDTNSDSIILKLTYGKISFLFTGDASSHTEDYLLKNNIDVSAEVLKVSHHGSRSATTNEFLRNVNPAIAVVSVGDNVYNLPNVEIMKSLASYGCEIYRTDKNGIVTLTTDGEKVQTYTEK